MIYLHPFHGRNAPEEELEDWGFDGPSIGPSLYFHVTYGSNLKLCVPMDVAQEYFPEEEKHGGHYEAAFECMACEVMLNLQGDLLEINGKFYGDWTITSNEKRS